ncbi:MAG: ABC transporter permease [Tyzzerella sp.]|nr:ABC transporter permease [Tyzzerella sp.]
MKWVKQYEETIIPVIALLLSLTVAGIVIALLGNNPFAVFANLLRGSGILPKLRYAGGKSMLTDLCSFLNYWTPMIFAALGVAVALKAGLFNIAISGQMLVAGFTSSVIVGYSSIQSVIAKPLVLLISIVAGGAVGALIGWLKYRFNINEVVSSIMLNYILQYIVAFFISMYYVDPISRQSRAVSDESRLTLANVEFGGYRYDIPLGMIVALFAIAGVQFVCKKTTLGYELGAVGLNRKAARYAGINVGRTMLLAMFISGALAGLAGATYYLGYFASIQPKVLAAMGYDSIAVALLGNSNPIGILFASFLISVIGKGSTYMSSTSGLDAELSSVIISLILLFSACKVYIRHSINKATDKRKARVEK